MKLQLSMDMVRTAAALDMVEKVHDVIDIVEVGTPMIVREGMAPVMAIREKYPQAVILADTKIVDGGEIEAADAFEAGADIVTVLGVAEDETIHGVVRAAKKFGGKIMVDLLCVPDIPERAAQLDGMGVDYICVHTAVDVQKTGRSPYHDLALLHPVLKRAKTALAGGVSLASIPLFRELEPEIVVVGGALTRQPDIRKAVVEMQAALK